jgi:CubicO group peptidase (beta-lactamase class C family)
MTLVNGAFEPAFKAVATAFAEGVADGESTGAALAIRHEGRTVIDLWVGEADPRDGAEWVEETPAVIFSCTKGLTSIMVAMLVEQGLLDYDEPAARAWPEFAAAGKRDATVGDLLAHRAGLVAPEYSFTPEEVLDWGLVTSHLAAQPPLWQPGSDYLYHTLTHGWLAGELIRRASGAMPGRFFAEHITTPLSADAWIGTPEGFDRRIAYAWSAMPVGDMAPPMTDAAEMQLLERSMTLGHAFPIGLVGDGTGFNDPRVLAADVPGAGGVATARALAAIWSATVVETEGVRLLGDEVVARASVVRSEGRPFVGMPEPWSRWGAGFQLDSDARRYLSPRSFGHDGAGGQVTFADPAARVGFAFLTNRMERGDLDTRATRVIDALREVLD